MTYRITGIDPSPFAHLAGLDDSELARHGAVRMTADSDFGFPCRVTLEDAKPGEKLLLVNHCSHDGNNPYRATHAIFVGEEAREPARYQDEIPPVMKRRILSLRAFDGDGMMRNAVLAQPGEADGAIRGLLADGEVDHIDAHTATRGCFVGRIDRD
jgi:hypothetical protein